ncbi:MAG TPA: BamA/TamA family outer membrane protein, partial [Longimicrobiales bacterium]|nr:BamA/TamA family outer membrane protein [Longimicrobiales bacterium]
ASTAAGQEVRSMTDAAADEMAAFYNRPSTTRLSAGVVLAEGAVVTGDVAVLGGSMEVRGVVRGDVVVLNGDLLLSPVGRIEGSATVVGGTFQGDTAAAADVVVYPEALRVRREDGRIVAAEPERPGALTAGRATRFGRTDLILAVDGSYNRAEGLPVALGGRVELGRSNPTVLDARLIYRTRAGFRIHPDEVGHDLRLEQYVGGHRSVALGLAKHNTVDPIELRGLSDTENSLSTFVLHRDYRDHYTRRGWSAYVRVLGRTRPLEAGLRYRDERHGSIQPGTPWSLLDNDEPWRPQPQVAEGDLRTVEGWVRWDTRNDPDDPSAGWLVDATVEQALEGSLSILMPDPDAAEQPAFTRSGVSSGFTSMTVDARRYFRLGPRTRVALRGLFAGSPDDGALPPQRQLALGGEGTMPGYGRFQLDCGARAQPADVEGYFPYYGCDRMLLAQAELRFSVLPGLQLGRRLGLDFDLLSRPEVVLFADAGRAWIEEESLSYRTDSGPGSLRFDAGAGLRLGRLGLYIAAPLEGESELNFFIRLGPRL